MHNFHAWYGYYIIILKAHNLSVLCNCIFENKYEYTWPLPAACTTNVEIERREFEIHFFRSLHLVFVPVGFAATITTYSVPRDAWRADIWKVFLRFANRVSSPVMRFRSEAVADAVRQAEWKARMKSSRLAQIRRRDETRRSIRRVASNFSLPWISRISWKRSKWRYDFLIHFELFPESYLPAIIHDNAGAAGSVELVEKLFGYLNFIPIVKTLKSWLGESRVPTFDRGN